MFHIQVQSFLRDKMRDNFLFNLVNLVEDVNLYETHLRWLRLEVVDAQSLEFIIVGEGILVLSRFFDELVRQNLDDFGSAFRSVSWNLPFVEILFGVELDSIEGIVQSFEDSQEIFTVGSCGSGGNSPELFQTGACIVVRKSNSIVMVVVKNALSIFEHILQTSRQIAEESAVSSDLDGVSHCNFSSHGGDGSRIVICSQVRQQLHSEAGSPNWERVALLLLSHGKFENVVGVLGPGVGDVDVDISSGEQDTIDFGEDLIKVRLTAVGINGDNLGSRHLQVLNVRSSNISVVGSLEIVVLGGSANRLIALIGLSEDTDDGSLVRNGSGKYGQSQEQYDQLHNRLYTTSISSIFEYDHEYVYPSFGCWGLLWNAAHKFHQQVEFSLRHLADFADFLVKDEFVARFAKSLVVLSEDAFQSRGASCDDLLVNFFSLGLGLLAAIGGDIAAGPLASWHEIAQLNECLQLRGGMQFCSTFSWKRNSRIINLPLEFLLMVLQSIVFLIFLNSCSSRRCWCRWR